MPCPSCAHESIADLPCPGKNTMCVAANSSNLLSNVTVSDDAECGGDEYWLTFYFNFHYWLLWIISALCHQNIFCYYWQSTHHSFKDENYAPVDRVFTCLLLSSCEPRTSLDYPTITNSGERTCLPDVFKRRKCKGCPCHRPWCHGRCVFDRACYFAPCSDSPYKEDRDQIQWHWPHNKHILVLGQWQDLFLTGHEPDWKWWGLWRAVCCGLRGCWMPILYRGETD